MEHFREIKKKRIETNRKKSGEKIRAIIATNVRRKKILCGKSKSPKIFALWLETHCCQCCRIHLISARDIN